ncbi:MAG: hypothetical protein ACM31C_14100 [Acidobacteriota bacterium]
MTTSRALLIALLVAAPAAYAQPADSPHDETVSQTTHEASELNPEATDPTAHFNFTNFDWRGKDEYGGPYGDGQEKLPNGTIEREEEPMSPPFVYMLINFALLLLVLGKWGAPAARKIAQDRHDQIKTALDEAKKLRDEAEQKLKDYESRIKDVDAEIAKLVEGIRADADADKKRILAAAEAQAAQMKRDAELRITAEIETARTQLAREVAIASTTATEKLLREKTTPDDQKQLVTSFISGMGGN